MKDFIYKSLKEIAERIIASEEYQSLSSTEKVKIYSMFGDAEDIIKKIMIDLNQFT